MAHILLPAFLGASLLAVTAPPRRRAPRAASSRSTALERTLPNGLRVIVVPTGFPNLVSLQIPVQTGSRNEVEPGKSGFAHFFEHMMFRGTKAYPPEALPGDPDARPGARQNAYTTDDYTNYHVDLRQGGPRDDPRDRGRPLPEPRLRRGGLQDRGARGPRRVQQEQRQPAPEAARGAARARLHDATPTSTRRWASSRTSRTCPTSSPTRRRSSTAGTGPSTRRVIVAGDVDAGRGRCPLVEKYWGAWKRGHATRSTIPAEPPPAGPVTAHVPWTTPTLPWVTRRLPRRPPSPRPRRTRRRSTCSLDLDLRPDLRRSTRSLVEEEQKVDQLFAVLPGRTPTRTLLTVVRARQEGRGRAVRARRRSCGPSPRAAREPLAGRSASPTRRRTPATRFAARARQHRVDRRDARALRALPPLVRHAQRALPRLRRAHARRPARPPRAATSSTPAWC